MTKIAAAGLSPIAFNTQPATAKETDEPKPLHAEALAGDDRLARAMEQANRVFGDAEVGYIAGKVGVFTEGFDAQKDDADLVSTAALTLQHHYGTIIGDEDPEMDVDVKTWIYDGVAPKTLVPTAMRTTVRDVAQAMGFDVTAPGNYVHMSFMFEELMNAVGKAKELAIFDATATVDMPGAPGTEIHQYIFVNTKNGRFFSLFAGEGVRDAAPPPPPPTPDVAPIIQEILDEPMTRGFMDGLRAEMAPESELVDFLEHIATPEGRKQAEAAFDELAADSPATQGMRPSFNSILDALSRLNDKPGGAAPSEA